MGNLRRCASRRFYGIIRKQRKLVEMHLYQQAPAISLHAPSPAAAFSRRLRLCAILRLSVLLFAL
jgi:hypothetical protein